MFPLQGEGEAHTASALGLNKSSRPAQVHPPLGRCTLALKVTFRLTAPADRKALSVDISTAPKRPC